MLTQFEKPEDSRELFFKLGDSLHITSFDYRSETSKFAGLYSIYKNNVCMYVGQSQNLASRLSQHISGKYESADHIVLFMAKANGFEDFHERGKEARKCILENNEKLLIKKLKPVENLDLPPQDFSIPEKERFNMFNDLSGDEDIESAYSDAHIFINKNYILVSGYEDVGHVMDIPQFKGLSRFVIDAYENYGEDAFERGVI